MTGRTARSKRFRVASTHLSPRQGSGITPTIVSEQPAGPVPKAMGALRRPGCAKGGSSGPISATPSVCRESCRTAADPIIPLPNHHDTEPCRWTRADHAHTASGYRAPAGATRLPGDRLRRRRLGHTQRGAVEAEQARGTGEPDSRHQRPGQTGARRPRAPGRTPRRRRSCRARGRPLRSARVSESPTALASFLPRSALCANGSPRSPS